MQVTIIGPNLRDQSKGSFRAHAAGCGDIDKDQRLTEEQPWEVDAETRLAVADHLYPRSDFEWTREADYVDDIWFAPCLKALASGMSA